MSEPDSVLLAHFVCNQNQVTIMVLKVDLKCCKCHKKIRIQDQENDEKNDTVRIKVVCCSPEKIEEKIFCKGGDTIKSIEIKVPEKLKEPEKPKEPERPKEPEKPKAPEKTKEPEKPKTPEKPKEPEKPKDPESLMSQRNLLKKERSPNHYLLLRNQKIHHLLVLVDLHRCRDTHRR
nr:protein PYRICULARIA ORYZAE RESISTANCE 21-like [Ziziphus jujuba var. spinosa]